MDPAEQRDDRVMSLVAEALKTPLRERDSFLLSACQTDTDLYREVTEILNWEDQMGDFLSRPLVDFIDLDALEQIFKPEQMVADRFQIIRRVGDGGMGVVYEAFDHIRQRRIAIKCPKLGYESMLPQELNALDVHHKNVCLVNDIHSAKTELGEVRFLTMEFLDGETLAHKLENGRLKEADAWQIARQLCSGVAEAARSNILHRDLKPGNIVLCPQKDGSTRAVITDFGLAVEASEVKDLEGGTPSYMAPELWRGSNGTQASDVFSLGVILYEMVTGSKPFPALNKENVTFPTPVAPSKIVKKLPRRWDDAILPCLRENPGERCSAEDVLAVLERKAFYRKPAVLVAIAACLLLALKLSIPPIIAYFTPAPIRLAILPPQGPSDDLIQQALNKLPASIKSMQTGTATVSVIPLSRTLEKQVTSHEQAEKVLDATHVLQLTSTKNDTGGVVTQGAIINLKTGETVGNYPAHLVDSDLPIGLEETVARVLDVPRTVNEEAVNPAADTAYTEGRKEFDRTPPDFARAICAFKEAARLDPHSALPLAGLVEAYARDFDANGGAAAKTAATCSAGPETDEARDSAPQDEAKEAASALASAQALNADSPRVLLASGLLHLFIENNRGLALNDYRRAQRISPENADAWVESGFAYEKQRNYDQAKAEYRKAIEISKHQYYRPYEYMGALDFFHGSYSEAEDAFKKDIELRGDRVDAYGSLGAAYTKEFKYSDALEVHRKALKLKETPLTLNNIGVALAFLGQDREAISYYRRALALKPDYYPCRWNLADALRRTQGPAAARADYQRALALVKQGTITVPDNTLYLTYRAYLEARLGLKVDARDHLAQAFSLHSQYPEVVLWAIETYEALGDRAHALLTAQTASAQILEQAAHQPNLAGLKQDPAFIRIREQKKNQ